MFAEFLFEVATHLSVLALGLVARPLLEWAAALRDESVLVTQALDPENPCNWIFKELVVGGTFCSETRGSSLRQL